MKFRVALNVSNVKIKNKEDIDKFTSGFYQHILRADSVISDKDLFNMIRDEIKNLKETNI
jgi:hypothetical protein